MFSKKPLVFLILSFTCFLTFNMILIYICVFVDDIISSFGAKNLLVLKCLAFLVKTYPHTTVLNLGIVLYLCGIVFMLKINHLIGYLVFKLYLLLAIPSIYVYTSFITFRHMSNVQKSIEKKFIELIHGHTSSIKTFEEQYKCCWTETCKRADNNYSICNPFQAIWKYTVFYKLVVMLMITGLIINLLHKISKRYNYGGLLRSYYHNDLEQHGHHHQRQHQQQESNFGGDKKLGENDFAKSSRSNRNDDDTRSRHSGSFAEQSSHDDDSTSAAFLISDYFNNTPSLSSMSSSAKTMTSSSSLSSKTATVRLHKLEGCSNWPQAAISSSNFAPIRNL